MNNLKDVVKINQENYDKLLNGETVSGNSFNSNNLYLVDGSYRVNDNLLINPDFKINQRQLTTLNTTANNKVYWVDRWLLWNNVGETSTANQTGTINNGVVSHTSTGNSWQGLGQLLENPERLSGKTITFTVCGHVDATTSRLKMVIGKYTGTISSNPTILNSDSSTNAINTTTDTIISTTVTLPNLTSNDKLLFLLWNSVSGATIYPKWAKVELGDKFTGYYPPQYDDELIKCYRYFQVFGTSNQLLAFGKRTNISGEGVQYEFSFPITVPFRDDPNIHLSTAFQPDILGRFITGGYDDITTSNRMPMVVSGTTYTTLFNLGDYSLGACVEYSDNTIANDNIYLEELCLRYFAADAEIMP